MKQVISPLFQVGICAVGYIYGTSSATLAQVTSDGTVNTQVNQNGSIAEITGGETRGSNLFHSFQDFSVPTGNGAFFNNADSISNIFSRVTGGNISNIDGLIRANGTASLFLINPAGIIFGENARLDIGGSFYGSSASSILFEDGEFSAADLENPPLLTVNAPIGLGFRDNPGDIVNRSDLKGTEVIEVLTLTDEALERVFSQELPPEVNERVFNGGEVFEEVLLDLGIISEEDIIRAIENINSIGLEVNQGKNLALIGGNVSIENSGLTALGGRISVGGLLETGNIEIDNSGNLIYPDNLTRGDVFLSNNSDINVASDGDGFININARNLELTEESDLSAGIAQNSGSLEAQAGDIIINVTEDIRLDNSFIVNSQFRGVGNSGDIIINTGSLESTNGGLVQVITTGQGNAGEIDITATGDITIDNSSFTSSSSNDGKGDTGGITISTNNLSLTNSGLLEARAFDESNTGVNAGVIDITANEDINIDDSRILSQGITISTNNLSLTNGSFVTADNFVGGQGDVGTIDITATGDITIMNDSGFSSSISFSGGEEDTSGITMSTNNLSLTNGSFVSADNFVSGQGDVGAIEITATGDITIDGSFVFSSSSLVFSSSGGEEDTSGITMSTNNLSLTNGGSVSAIGFSGQGNVEAIDITASNDVNVDGQGSTGDFSGIFTSVDITDLGNAGSINLSTVDLNLTNGGQISAETTGESNAGDVNISSGNLKLENLDSGIFSRTGGTGNSGTVNIDTANLQIEDNAQVAVNNFVETSLELDTSNPNIPRLIRVFDPIEGSGSAGTLEISSNNIQLIDGGTITALSAGGDGGNININSDFLSLRNGSNISTSAGLQNTLGSGGDINIDSQFIIAFPQGNNDITANAFEGSGGNITILTEGIFGIQERPNNPLTNDITASSEAGISGNITITTPDINPIQGATELPTNVVEPGETTEQACQANREALAKGGLNIVGKGGIIPDPALPLNSLNVIANGENTPTSTIPAPIETAQGKIQPARGVTVTESGEIILTAYRTNNSGDRIPEGSANCGRV